MRVKIFSGDNLGEIENELNEWLRINEGVEVIYVKQSESGIKREGRPIYSKSSVIIKALTISIFYK